MTPFAPFPGAVGSAAPGATAAAATGARAPPAPVALAPAMGNLSLSAFPGPTPSPSAASAAATGGGPGAGSRGSFPPSGAASPFSGFPAPGVSPAFPPLSTTLSAAAPPSAAASPLTTPAAPGFPNMPAARPFPGAGPMPFPPTPGSAAAPAPASGGLPTFPPLAAQPLSAPPSHSGLPAPLPVPGAAPGAGAGAGAGAGVGAGPGQGGVVTTVMPSAAPSYASSPSGGSAPAAPGPFTGFPPAPNAFPSAPGAFPTRGPGSGPSPFPPGPSPFPQGPSPFSQGPAAGPGAFAPPGPGGFLPPGPGGFPSAPTALGAGAGTAPAAGAGAAPGAGPTGFPPTAAAGPGQGLSGAAPGGATGATVTRRTRGYVAPPQAMFGSSDASGAAAGADDPAAAAAAAGPAAASAGARPAGADGGAARDVPGAMHMGSAEPKTTPHPNPTPTQDSAVGTSMLPFIAPPPHPSAEVINKDPEVLDRYRKTVQLKLSDAGCRVEKIVSQSRSCFAPPVRARCVFTDNGNATPRFVRMTLNAIPADPDRTKQHFIPIGGLLQPLATPEPGEKPVPEAALPSSGMPVRCRECGCYVNPYFRFSEVGDQFTCPMCEVKQPVPEDYHCSVDNQGVRRDYDRRPELRYGSVEYPAPVALRQRPQPQPAGSAAAASSQQTHPAVTIVHVFSIDASAAAVASGFFAASIEASRAAVEKLASVSAEEAATASATGAPVPKAPLVVVQMFSNTVQMAVLSPPGAAAGQTEVEVVAVTDTNNPFLPLPASNLALRLDTPEAAANIDAALVSMLHIGVNDFNGGYTTAAAAMGAAAQVAVLVMEELAGVTPTTTFSAAAAAVGNPARGIGGGKVSLFLATLPNSGVGALGARENIANYRDAAKTSKAAAAVTELYGPQTPYYEELSLRAVRLGLGFDIYLCAGASGLLPSTSRAPGTKATASAANANAGQRALAEGYTDLVSWSPLAATTGGQINRYPLELNNSMDLRDPVPPFTADAAALTADVVRSVAGRASGYNAVLIVRTSRGLKLDRLYGNMCHMQQEYRFAQIDSDKTLGFTLVHTDRGSGPRGILSTSGTGVWKTQFHPHKETLSAPDNSHYYRNEVCIQLALLYTSAQGFRRLRTHTVSHPVTSSAHDIFSCADNDALVGLLTRQIAAPLYFRNAAAASHDMETSETLFESLREACVNSLIVMLRRFKRTRFTGSYPPSGSTLVMPERLSLSLLSYLSLIRSEMLLDEGFEVRVDDRIATALRLSVAPAVVTSYLAIPPLYNIMDQVREPPPFDPDTGLIVPPLPLRPWSHSLDSRSIFVLDDGSVLFIYCGAEVPLSVTSAVFVRRGGRIMVRSPEDAPAPGTEAAPVYAALSDLLATLQVNRNPTPLVRVILSSDRDPKIVFDPNVTRSRAEWQFRARFSYDDSVRSSASARANKSPQSMGYHRFLSWVFGKVDQKV